MNSSLTAQLRTDKNPVAIGTQQRPTKKLNRGEVPPELKEKLKITESEKIEFREILKDSKVKLAKIWNSLCKPERVVNVQDVLCFGQFNFIFASSITFAKGDSFASISLIKGQFWAGKYGPINSLLVDLGEVDFSQITKEAKEVKILNDFPLAYNAQSQKMETISGSSKFQGLKISDTQPAELNHTYLLRSAIYSKNYLSTDSSQIIRNQIKENIHAFKVIKEKDNLVTMVWKKIESKQEFVKSEIN
jgi:hypothetical protein